ncbi:MAG: hypothetical protein ACKN89_08155 [Cyanobium sp.]|nr:hypothetical protein [Synechococcaceae cyanobacterium]
MASSSSPAAQAPVVGPDAPPPAASAACGSGLTAGQEDPILCGHCGRSASNGLSCIGMCVADTGY